MQTSPTGVDEHRWGDAPELYGPRHDFRESLLIRQLADRVQRGHVLNAGCGAGSLTLKLLDRGFEVTSVDASEAFVARLAAELARRGQDGSAEVGDLHSLRFPDGSFDAVVSGEVLEHLADDATAVREFARALRPGGVLAVSVPANPWRYDWTDRWAGHERRYTAEGLRALLEDAGLTDIAVVPYGFPVTGLYHRHIYRRMLRRRLASDAGRLGGPAGATRRLAPLVRAALQIDTLFLGRFPGYFGLLASARRP